jgi:lysyl-tRNA synthetase class I
MAIGAAILAELLLNGRIDVDEDGKKKFARVLHDRSLDDPLLDECLQRIVNSKKRQQLQTWVSRFANTRNLKHRVALQLCRSGVLKEDEDKVLWIFKRKVYPEVDPRPERAIIQRLEKAVHGAGPVDGRTTALVAIADSSNLLKNAIEKKRLKERKDRIKRIANGDAAGKAARDAVQAAQAAAALAAVIAASTVATTTAVTSS